MATKYVRAGIPRDLQRRERNLHYLRNFFSERILDNLDEESRESAKEMMALGLELHIRLCSEVLKKVREYSPTYFNESLRKLMPLTPEAVDVRRQKRLLLARAHEDEVRKRKARLTKAN